MQFGEEKLNKIFGEDCVLAHVRGSPHQSALHITEEQHILFSSAKKIRLMIG